MSNTIETINPSTGKAIATYNSMSTEEVNQKTKNARIAFENWRRIDISERCAYMRRLGRVMKKNKEDYARLITEKRNIEDAPRRLSALRRVSDFHPVHFSPEYISLA